MVQATYGRPDQLPHQYAIDPAELTHYEELRDLILSKLDVVADDDEGLSVFSEAALLEQTVSAAAELIYGGREILTTFSWVADNEGRITPTVDLTDLTQLTTLQDRLLQLRLLYERAGLLDPIEA